MFYLGHGQKTKKDRIEKKRREERNERKRERERERERERKGEKERERKKKIGRNNEDTDLHPIRLCPFFRWRN